MSDQDFFFDDEEVKQEKASKPASKSASKTGGTAKKAESAKKAVPVEVEETDSMAAFLSQQVSVTIAGLVALITLLVGVIVGFAIPKSGSSVSPISNTPVQTAPQLSPEQLNSGQLPPGHPAVGNQSGGSQQKSKTSTSTGK